MNNTQIDVQALINKMTTNYASAIALKDQQIAQQEVTIETLQNQLNQLKEKDVKNVKNK